jgi:hypothetical protein
MFPLISSIAGPSASSIGMGLTEERRRYASPRSSSATSGASFFPPPSALHREAKKAGASRLPLTFQP